MPNYSMQNIDSYMYNHTGAAQENVTCNIVYPEVYYKVQPFVMFACDQMQSSGNIITQQILDQIGENIYTNVCLMNPDLEEYAQQYQMKLSVHTAQQDFDLRSNGGLFRRRGIFQDYIDLLLLNEMLRRGIFF